MNSKTNSPTESAASSFNAVIPLWASAFVIAALVIMQTARIGAGNNAIGEMAIAGMDYTMLTTNSGNGEILAVLNNRDGNMYAYEVTSSKGINMVDRVNFSDLVAQRQGGN